MPLGKPRKSRAHLMDGSGDSRTRRDAMFTTRNTALVRTFVASGLPHRGGNSTWYLHIAGRQVPLSRRRYEALRVNWANDVLLTRVAEGADSSAAEVAATAEWILTSGFVASALGLLIASAGEAGVARIENIAGTLALQAIARGSSIRWRRAARTLWLGFTVWQPNVRGWSSNREIGAASHASPWPRAC